MLFTSSLRFNLDPLNQCADSDIWLALEACQLKELVRKSKQGLHWHLEEGGINLRFDSACHMKEIVFQRGRTSARLSLSSFVEGRTDRNFG